MDKCSTLPIITASLLLAFLASCAPSATGNIQLAVPTDEILLVEEAVGLDLSPCLEAGSHVMIAQHQPRSRIVSTTPTFTWFYYIIGGSPVSSLEAWDEVCVPDSYTLYLSTGPDFDDEIIFQVIDPSVERDLGKLTLEWTLDGSLQPLKEYRWLMVGHDGDILLDDWKLSKLHDDAWWEPQSGYFDSLFRTGPECGPGGIPVPRLSYPVEGELINTLNPTLIWDVAGSCMPVFFVVEVSTVPAFDSPDFEGYPPSSGDYTGKRWAWRPMAYLDYMLRDCTQYYWRITAGIGPAGSGVETEYGGTSEVRSFSVDLGACTAFTQIRKMTPEPPFEPVLPTDEPWTLATEPPVVPVTCTGLDQGTCINTQGCAWVPGFGAGSYCAPE